MSQKCPVCLWHSFLLGFLILSVLTTAVPVTAAEFASLPGFKYSYDPASRAATPLSPFSPTVPVSPPSYIPDVDGPREFVTPGAFFTPGSFAYDSSFSGRYQNFDTGSSGSSSYISPTLPISPPLTISLQSPESKESVKLIRGTSGIYTFSASGKISGYSQKDHRILLWVKPLQPPSETPGWYLQRYPFHGVQTISMDGTWIGRCQLGNGRYDPHEGDIFDLMVTVVDPVTEQQLKSVTGDVVEDYPIGTPSDTASDVVARMEMAI